MDFNWRPDKNWTINAQGVESSTKQSNPNSAAGVFPPGYFAGPATDVQVNRSGHSFNLRDEYQDVSTGFLSRVGFFQTSNIRSDSFYTNYQWYPKKSTVQTHGYEASGNIAYDHSGNPVYRYLSFDYFVTLPRNLVFAPIVGQNRDTVGPQNGYPLTANHTFVENNVGFVTRGQPWSQFSFNFRAFKEGNA